MSISRFVVNGVRKVPAGWGRTVGIGGLCALLSGAPVVAVVNAEGAALIRFPAVMAWLWLSVSPVLIAYGADVIERYLGRMSVLLPREESEAYTGWVWSRVYSQQHLLLSGLLAAGFGAAALYDALARGYPLKTRIYVSVLCTLAGFMAGIGFWAISRVPEILRRLGTLNVKIDPFHPDGFGGLRHVGTFSAELVVVFFSGSLFMPYGFDIVSTTSGGSIATLTEVIVGSFVLIGLISFMQAVVIVHDIVFAAKVEADRISGDTLQRLLERDVLADGGANDIGQVLKPWVYFKTYHSQIGSMKEYPFEGRTIVELLGSVLIPVVVFLLDKLYR